MNEHILDEALERYYRGRIEEGDEMASLEEHLLWCDSCIARALAKQVRIGVEDNLRKESEMATAKCAYCGAETELWDNGVPVCLACANAKTKPKNLTAAPGRLIHR
jgi:hypothetical protein